MDAIRKILLPTDFSANAQNAFRHGLMLADRMGAEIELLHVIYPEYEPLDLPVMAAQATREKAEAARVVMKEFMELGLAQMHTTGQIKSVPPIHADLEVGTPASLISEVARRDEADLIVMGTRGRHNTLERFWGSTATAVLEHAPCHVMVVPEHAPYQKIEQVGYATDLAEADPYHIWEAGKILDAFSPVIRCAHVNLEQSVEHALDLNGLGHFFDNHAPALQITFHTLQGGQVAPALDQFIDQFGLDLMVMYAPGHSWWQRLFHHSETKAMALRAQVPVLFLKH